MRHDNQLMPNYSVSQRLALKRWRSGQPLPASERVGLTGVLRARPVCHARWSRAVSGDAAAAIALALDTLWRTPRPDERCDRVMSALQLSASDPAARLVFALLRSRLLGRTSKVRP